MTKKGKFPSKKSYKIVMNILEFAIIKKFMLDRRFDKGYNIKTLIGLQLKIVNQTLKFKTIEMNMLNRDFLKGDTSYNCI